MKCKVSAMLYDNFKKCHCSVYTLMKLSRKDKLAGPRFFAFLPHFRLLILVGDARIQGCGWNSYEGVLSMCALNRDGGGGGGRCHASVTGRDAWGFYCDCCGSWTASTMSQGAGVTSPCVFEPYENMVGSWARYTNTGHGGYIRSGQEPLLAVIPHPDAHARVREQLFQGLLAMDELAVFGTEVTGSLPLLEGPFADDLDSTEVLRPNGFGFNYDLFASPDSLVLPEQSIPQASAPMARSVHAGHAFNGMNDVPNQRTGKRRAVCPVPGCGISFSRQSDVPRHIRTGHGKKERHFCDFPDCKKSFSRQDKLTGHKRKHDTKGQVGLGLHVSNDDVRLAVG